MYGKASISKEFIDFKLFLNNLSRFSLLSKIIFFAFSMKLISSFDLIKIV